MPTYKELLQDPRWDVKRKEILKRDNYQCRECEAIDCVLQVHHHYYILNTMPWEYDDEIMITLCESCHEEEEFLKNWDVLQRQYLYTIGLTRKKLGVLTSALSQTIGECSESEVNREFKKLIQKIRG